jgi:ubiquinone/menaquinone biosynthesis C-methylase UbiE
MSTLAGDERAQKKTEMTRVTNYDAVAAGYDVRYRTYDYAEIKGALRTFLESATPPAIVEIGCGTGFWLRALIGQGAPIVGLDSSSEMIQRARGSGAMLVRGRAEELPFGDRSVDRIICINALHHFSDRSRFFEESRRILRAGGGLFNVGLDPHAERDSWWVYDYFPEARRIDFERYTAVRAIRGELVKADFTWSESCEVQTFEHLMPAARAFERGLVARSFTSQLAVLTDEEFEAGVARIRGAMAESAKSGDELMLASELHLFATIGWIAA